MVKTYKLAELFAEKSYVARPRELFSFKAKTEGFNIVQGSVFDGERFFVALNSKKDGVETTRIQVLDKNGKFLRESPELCLDHANSLSFAPDGKLFVAHCQSKEGSFNRYSLVDPESFEIIKTEDLERPFFAMAYCEKTQCFGSGQWGGQTLNVWSKELVLLKEENVEKPKSLSQGVCATEDGLFFIRSDQNGAPSELRHYNWELELVYAVVVNFENGVEAEDISVVDGEAYVVAGDQNRGCAVAYKLEFEEE